jgi:hypothetical protein
LKQKILKSLGVIFLIGSFTWFFYGSYRFYDGPISLCGENKYCGKQGQIHSKEDYDSFIFWKNTSFPSHLVSMIIIYLLNKYKN